MNQIPPAALQTNPPNQPLSGDDSQLSPKIVANPIPSAWLAAGFTARSHRLRCYVLIGYPKDTFNAAEKRLADILEIGFTPHAMLWAPETPSAEKYRPAPEWRRFQRRWARPAIIHSDLNRTKRAPESAVQGGGAE